MSQVDLPTSIGYALKRAATALRAAMDADLRDCGLSVAQYSALELLVQRAGLTNAEAADALGISSATADKDWAYAKTWLRVAMREDRDSGTGSEESPENPGNR